MLRQRAPDAAPAVQGDALHLPFADASFDAAMALLTIHHWPDWRAGLRECLRVAPRLVVFTWDPEAPHFWLSDYLSEIRDLDRHLFAPLEAFDALTGRCEVVEIPVPHDCSDGFLCAYWRRPEAYLDPEVRRSISTFARVGDRIEGLDRLARDLESGVWRDRYRDLLDRESLDLGYRLVVVAT